LQSEKGRVSADRRNRFITPKPIAVAPLSTSSSEIWKSTTLSRGDYIFLMNGNQLLYGQCLNVQFYRETFKYRRFYNGDEVDLKRSDIANIGVKLDPLFTIQGSQKLREINTNDYFSLNNYKSHASETLDFSKRATLNVLRGFRN